MAETAAAPLSGLSPKAIEGFRPNVISAGTDKRGSDLKKTLKEWGKKFIPGRKPGNPENPDEGKDMGWNVGAAPVRDRPDEESPETTMGRQMPNIGMRPPNAEPAYKPDSEDPGFQLGSWAERDPGVQKVVEGLLAVPEDPERVAAALRELSKSHPGVDPLSLASRVTDVLDSPGKTALSPDPTSSREPSPAGAAPISADQPIIQASFEGQPPASSNTQVSAAAEAQPTQPQADEEAEGTKVKPIEVTIGAGDSDEEKAAKIEAAIAQGKAQGGTFSLIFSGDGINGPIIPAKIRANILGQEGVEGAVFTERTPGAFTLEIETRDSKPEQGGAQPEVQAAGGPQVGEGERQARADDGIEVLRSQSDSGSPAVEPESVGSQPASVRVEVGEPQSAQTKEEMERKALGEIAQRIVDEGLDPDRMPEVVNNLNPAGVEMLRKALMPKLFLSASEGQTPEVLGAYWNKWFTDKAREFKEKGMLTPAQRDQAEEEGLRSVSERTKEFNRWVDWAESQPVRDNEGNRVDAQREAVLVQRLEKIYPDLEGLPFNRILSSVLIAERLSPSEVNRILNRTGIPYERARAIREDISSIYAIDVMIDDISKVPEEWRSDPGFQEFADRYTEESGLEGGKWISELRARKVSDNDRSWGQRMVEGLPKRRPLGPEREIKVGGSPTAPLREPRKERLYGVKGDALVPRHGIDRLVDLGSREAQVGGRPLMVDGEVFQPGGRLAVTPEIPQDRDNTSEPLPSSGPEQSTSIPPAPSVADRTADELLTQQFYGTVEERAERIKDGVNRIGESLKKIEERSFSVKDAEEVFADAESLVRNGMTGEGMGVLRLQDEIKDVLDSPRGLVVKAQFNEVFFEEVERYGQEDNLDGIKVLFGAARVLGFYKNKNVPGINEEIDRVEGILGLNSPKSTPPPFPGSPAPDYT